MVGHRGGMPLSAATRRRPAPRKLTPAAPVQVMRGMFAASTGRIDDRWRAFMAFQIGRARDVFTSAEEGVGLLDADARWPVW